MNNEPINEQLAAARATRAWIKFQRQNADDGSYKIYHAMRNHMIRYCHAHGASQRVLSRVLGVRAPGSQLKTGANDAQLLTVKNLCEKYLTHLRAKDPGAKPRS